MARQKKHKAEDDEVHEETPAEASCDEYQSDLATSIGRKALNQQDRQTTRAEALLLWASQDIRRLERIEDAGHWGWGMWRYA